MHPGETSKAGSGDGLASLVKMIEWSLLAFSEEKEGTVSRSFDGARRPTVTAHLFPLSQLNCGSVLSLRVEAFYLETPISRLSAF